MKRAIAVTALALCFMSASSWAQGADDQSADAPDSSHWFDVIAGKKLVAVDDSTMAVWPSEAGLNVEIVSPSGATRKLELTFVGDGVGTISDGGAKAIGVFRQTDSNLRADFSDGHTEIFTLNPAGGVSMMLSTPQSTSYCMRWYPEGHVFDAADRKAALAAYANKLGLSDTAPKSGACNEPASITPPSPSPKPRMAHLQKHEAVEKAAEQTASVQPISVRTSEVHLIDAPAADAIAQQTVQHAPVMMQTPQIAPPTPDAPKSQQAALHPVIASASHDKLAAPHAEASSCLSVDTDGNGWGFRNTCGYTVQFAYCLKNGTDKSTACGSGTGSGDVEASGFVPVLAKNEIVTAEEEFRWVACAGGADQVAARLDRPDPPAGRCVPVRAL